jgi:hypothetical protein
MCKRSDTLRYYIINCAYNPFFYIYSGFSFLDAPEFINDGLGFSDNLSVPSIFEQQGTIFGLEVNPQPYPSYIEYD